MSKNNGIKGSYYVSTVLAFVLKTFFTVQNHSCTRKLNSPDKNSSNPSLAFSLRRLLLGLL